MDLTAAVTYIWNILILLSWHVPGTILYTIEYNNARLRGNPQLDLKAVNALENVRKVTLSSSTETTMPATNKKPRELATSAAAATIKPIVLTPSPTSTSTSSSPSLLLSSSLSSSSKATLSSFQPDAVSGILTGDLVPTHYHQENKENKRVNTNNVTLTTSTKRTKHPLDDSSTSGGDSDAPHSLPTLNGGLQDDSKYAPMPQAVMSPTYDVVKYETGNYVRPLGQSANNHQALETPLMKVNVRTMSIGNTKATSNQPYFNTNSTVINDSYGPIGGEHDGVVLTTMATRTTTSSFAIEGSNNSHMYNVSRALTYFPYESAASVAHADANAMHINANRGGSMTAALPSPVVKETNVFEKHFKHGTVALVQDAGDDVQTQYYFKNNNSSALTRSLGSEITSSTTHGITPSNATVIATMNSSSKMPPSATSTLATANPSLTTTSMPTPTSSSTSSSSAQKVTRRPVATTTPKPAPTIDDYQTVTSQAGTHAYLPCNVKQLVKKPISWLRVRDGHILTVDQTTFIADQRFQSIFSVNPERWSLQIKYVQLKDAGIYECQVSTEPKASAIVYLQVVEPKTELIGAPTRHVKAGSQVKLLCIISQALEPPLFINWFYNQKQIYLHNRKGWRTEIERIELPPDTTTTAATTTFRTTATTTTTTTHTPASTTSSAPLTTTTTSSSSRTSSTTAGSPSLISGSEVPAMHVFTSITPQSLNDGNLLDMVSESTYHPNLIQPEAFPSIPTTHTTATITAASASAAVASTSSAVGTATTTTTQPKASAATPVDQILSTAAPATTVAQAEDDFTSNPSLTAARTSMAVPELAASAAERGYMMLSTLMTVTDVKQITAASLIIPSVQKQDSGNYTCSPSNSEPRTVILHVLNGEYSASAITSGVTGINFQHHYLIIQSFVLVVTNYIVPICWIHTKGSTIRRYCGG